MLTRKHSSLLVILCIIGVVAYADYFRDQELERRVNEIFYGGMEDLEVDEAVSKLTELGFVVYLEDENTVLTVRKQKSTKILCIKDIDTGISIKNGVLSQVQFSVENESCSFKNILRYFNKWGLATNKVSKTHGVVSV